MEKHLYHVQKQLVRTSKKVKTLILRKLIRRIKTETKPEKKTSLEANLLQLKSQKPSPQALMAAFVGLWDEELRSRCPQSSPNCVCSEFDQAIIAHKIFQAELEHELASFRKVLQPTETLAKKHTAQHMSIRKPVAVDTKKDFNMRSFFMSSLSNQCEDEVMRRRSHQDSSVKKKNRPGQRARRAMAGVPQVPHPKVERWNDKGKQETLHPSWEAARQLKAKASKAIASAPRQHIVFDE